MTIIVTDGISMVADGRTMWGDTVLCEEAIKVYKYPHALVGVAGNASAALGFGWEGYKLYCKIIGIKDLFAPPDTTLAGIPWEKVSEYVEREKNKSPIDTECDVLITGRDGRSFVWSTGDCMHLVPTTRITAIGSGKMVAMGAMKAGATPVEAVRICMDVIPTIGGRIQEVKFDD